MLLNTIGLMLPPVGTLPVAIDEAITFFIPLISWLTYWIPLTTLLEVLGLVLLFEARMFIFKVVVFIYNRIPIVGH